MAEASVVASTSEHTADDAAVLILDNPPLTAEHQKRPSRKNLPKEAYQILQDYFFNVNQFPKKHERLELAEKVNRVPGCESGGYTAIHVRNYFANMRKRHPQPSSVVVKRELVEEPLSFGGSELSTNGATVEGNASSISTAPRKKRKLQGTAVAQSSAPMSVTTSQHLLSSASTNGSMSNMFLPAYAPSSASAPPATQRKKWTRLKAEGSKVLNDFFNNVSRYPTAAQKAELLAAVTSIPGCEGYTHKKLTAWFSRMRMERKEQVAFVKAESPDLQVNAAVHSAGGPPSASFLVPPSTPGALPPVIPPAHPCPVQLAPSMPQPQPQPQPPPQSQPQPLPLHQPPAPTPSAVRPSKFSVFSIYEPLLCTPQALPQPHHAYADPQPTAADPPTTVGEGMSADLFSSVCIDNRRVLAGFAESLVPLQNLPQNLPVVQPPPPPPPPTTTAVGSYASPAPPDVAEPAETADTMIQDSSDPIPSPSPSPKSSRKGKPELTVTRRALTDAALKLLDDYYANVSPNPSQSQCATLASQIGELPEDGRCVCTAKQVRKYFKKWRVEERCEALKEERMGAGADEPPQGLVLVAIVEPEAVSNSGSMADESVHHLSDADPRIIASDPVETSASELGTVDVGGEVVELISELSPEMSSVDAGTGDPGEHAASSSALAPGDGSKTDNDNAVPDIAMEDVLEHTDPEDVVFISYHGECSNDHTQIPTEERRTDVGIEADIELAERGAELAVEGSKLDESSLETDLAEDLAAPSLLASGDWDVDNGGENIAGVSTDDGPENHEPEDVLPDTPESVKPDECSDNHAQIPVDKEQTNEELEVDIEHAEHDLVTVPEVEPVFDSKPDESAPACEVMTVAQDPAEVSASTPPALDGEEESSGGRALPEVCMHDVHESPKPEDAASLKPSDGDRSEDGTPMDVDSDPAPSVIQVDVLALAAQLQRVFSRPPALDADPPTTFADFATWLEAQNGSLVCASS
ncbi:transcription factor [Ganoderma sinense ZZ0214-1]|uniref:Transcription factor n=1 Tax=Ganoderma sinense ZZ0214-1 TaxID=1077348 RepID=A0A2G8S2D9_9APHY|nr:transcription factor [Ganoderma sinense ZZ0214-1]